MQSLGCINGVVPWRQARKFFYWRLRRRLAEGSLVRRLIKAAPQMLFAHATTLLRSWFLQILASVGEGGPALSGPGPAAALWADDMRVLRWLVDHRDVIEANVAALRRESIAEQVLALGSEDPGAAVTGVLALIARLPTDRREAAIASLRRGIIFGASSL
jgi:acetyl-CoA carboxylase/biotin carboxylase 1